MFVGNKRIEKIARIIARDIQNGKFDNILITGKSGMGKTTLAFYIAELAGIEPYLSYGYKVRINHTWEVNIVDEVHGIKDINRMLKIMDSKITELIFTTTELGDLPEPFYNRCFIINIPDYDYGQLKEIAQYYNNGYFPQDVVEEVINRSRGVPRVIRFTLERLKSYFDYENVPINLRNCKIAMDLFGIYENGFTENDYLYLKAFENSEYLSLESIRKITGLPKDTIEQNIEPFLLRNNLLEITSKGRKKKWELQLYKLTRL